MQAGPKNHSSLLPTDENWQVKETQFHLEQLLDRAKLRIREERATLVDYLLVNSQRCGVFWEGNPVEALYRERHSFDDFIKQMEDLLDCDREGRELWEATKAWMEFLVKGKRSQSRVNEGVLEDIKMLLGQRSFEELCRLELQSRRKMASADADPDYWEGVLQEIKEFKAKARLIDCNKRLLEQRRREVDPPALSTGEYVEFYRGQMTSKRLKEQCTPSGTDNWDDSPRALYLLQVYSTKAVGPDRTIIHHHLAEGNKSSGHVKPRYVCWAYMRVEWTKYNQAHYTADNPPSPTPHAYSFNIFYPLLSDPTKTPAYFTEADPADPDNYQFVRFRASPPYEDLVFRLPANKWELSHKNGFRCTFEGSVLTLDFQFRKQFYR